MAVSGQVYERRAAVLALGLVGSYQCKSTIARAINDRDRGVRMVAESGVFDVWARAGNDAQQKRLSIIKRLNLGGLFEQAADMAESLCDLTPGYAEAWNQLGISQFFLGRPEDSIQSCWRAYAVNPYQFEAALGLGHAYLELDEPLSALEFYEQALELNSNLEAVRIQVDRMQRSYRNQ